MKRSRLLLADHSVWEEAHACLWLAGGASRVALWMPHLDSSISGGTRRPPRSLKRGSMPREELSGLQQQWSYIDSSL